MEGNILTGNGYQVGVLRVRGLDYFLFLILINAAGYEILEKQLGGHITQKKNRRTSLIYT